MASSLGLPNAERLITKKPLSEEDLEYRQPSVFIADPIEIDPTSDNNDFTASLDIMNPPTGAQETWKVEQELGYHNLTAFISNYVQAEPLPVTSDIMPSVDVILPSSTQMKLVANLGAVVSLMESLRVTYFSTFLFRIGYDLFGENQELPKGSRLGRGSSRRINSTYIQGYNEALWITPAEHDDHADIMMMDNSVSQNMFMLAEKTFLFHLAVILDCVVILYTPETFLVESPPVWTGFPFDAVDREGILTAHRKSKVRTLIYKLKS